MTDMNVLLEKYGYQEIWGRIDWDFIHMRQHYDAIRDLGISFKGQEGDVSEFSAPSESNPGSRHKVFVQMTELEEQLKNPQNSNIGDATKAAMGGELKLHCDCKAFIYWGYQYILGTMDAAMYDVGFGDGENWNFKKITKPKVYYKTDRTTGRRVIDRSRTRNAMLRGAVCKHLGNVLKVYPFWWNTIAGELQRAGYDVAASTVEVPVEPRQPAVAQPTRQPQPGRQAAQPKQGRVPRTRRRAKPPEEVPTFPELVGRQEPESPRQQTTPKKTTKKKAKKRKRPRAANMAKTFGLPGESFAALVDRLLERAG